MARLNPENNNYDKQPKTKKAADYRLIALGLLFVLLCLGFVRFKSCMQSRLHPKEPAAPAETTGSEILSDTEFEKYKPSIDYESWMRVADETVSKKERLKTRHAIETLLANELYPVSMKRINLSVATFDVDSRVMVEENKWLGELVGVVGKVRSIEKVKKNPDVARQAARYVCEVETPAKNLVRVRTVNIENGIVEGDIIEADGVCLKFETEPRALVVFCKRVLRVMPQPRPWDYPVAKWLRYAENFLKKKHGDVRPDKIRKSLDHYQKKFIAECENWKSMWENVQDSKPSESKELNLKHQKTILSHMFRISSRDLLYRGERNPDYTGMKEKPDTHRGTVNRVFGYLKHIKVLLIGDPIEGQHKVFKGTVQDLKGRTYLFRSILYRAVPTNALMETGKVPMPQPKKGDAVLLSGIFYKRSFTRPAPDKTEEWLPFLFAREVFTFGNQVSIFSVIDEGGDPDRHYQAADGESFMGGYSPEEAAHTIELLPYSYFLSKVESVSVADLKAGVAARGEMPSFDEMMRYPAKYRDKPLKIHGRVLRTERLENMDGRNITGVNTIYGGQLRDRDYHIYSFRVVDAKQDFNKELVTIYGYLYKRWSYESRSGTYRWTPLIVGRLGTVFKEKEEPILTSFNIILTVLILGIGGFLLISSRKETVSANERVRHFTERRLKVARPKFQKAVQKMKEKKEDSNGSSEPAAPDESSQTDENRD